MFDLVIRNGSVVDGTGAEAVNCDVGITDGVITEIGPDLGAAQQTIDADGALVTPGFVDIHTHYDGQTTWDELIAPSCWHGVTTVVMGSCGVGFAPVEPSRHEWSCDLPAGAGRLIQRADGYLATVKGGSVTFENGEATDARPGNLLRHAR